MVTQAQLEQLLGKGKLKTNFNLSPYFTLKTTTVAEFYMEATIRDNIIAAQKASCNTGVPLFFIAGGSNFAVTKQKINGLVVHNKYITKKVVQSNDQTTTILVSSGYPVTKLVKETVDAGLAGLEYHLGLPGTVGGAVFMNSKWTHPPSYFGDTLVYANLVDTKGNVKKVDREYFQFAYDYSILQKTHEIVLEAAFQFKKTDPMLLQKKAKEAMEYRKKTQPFGVFTSGCFFKNISVDEMNKIHSPTTSAGYLIDKAGLKGKTIGNFFVSDKHANFIINKGNGNPKDLVKLIDTVKETVKNKFGITLKEEVILI